MQSQRFRIYVCNFKNYYEFEGASISSFVIYKEEITLIGFNSLYKTKSHSSRSNYIFKIKAMDLAISTFCFNKHQLQHSPLYQEKSTKLFAIFNNILQTF